MMSEGPAARQPRPLRRRALLHLTEEGEAAGARAAGARGGGARRQRRRGVQPADGATPRRQQLRRRRRPGGRFNRHFGTSPNPTRIMFGVKRHV